MFAKCATMCCTCASGIFCLAGNGDDDYSPASVEEVIRRIRAGEYADDRDMMIRFVKAHGVKMEDE